MTTETVDRVYCSYSGADISLDVNVHIHIWETFVPKEKLQEELDFLEEQGFDLNLVEVDEFYFRPTVYRNGRQISSEPMRFRSRRNYSYTPYEFPFMYMPVR